jgi:hypothetical protein
LSETSLPEFIDNNIRKTTNPYIDSDQDKIKAAEHAGKPDKRLF